MSTYSMKDLIQCVNFAAVKHRNQRKKDPQATPYINHPIGVAYILTEEAGISDTSVVQAALLHDTVEDTDTSINEISETFGNDIAGLVAEVTDDKSLPKLERKRLQIEHASHASPRAKLVKLADKLYNLRDLQQSTPSGWTDDRVMEYFQWASQVVKGLRGTNPYMENELDNIFKQRGITID